MMTKTMNKVQILRTLPAAEFFTFLPDREAVEATARNGYGPQLLFPYYMTAEEINDHLMRNVNA